MKKEQYEVKYNFQGLGCAIVLADSYNDARVRFQRGLIVSDITPERMAHIIRVKKINK